MSKQQYQSLSSETHVARRSDMTFEKVLHKGSSANTGGIGSMLGKDREASKAAINEYFQHWDGKTAKNETSEVREARKADYATLTRQYYNLATDFYEYGWCQSFHFCRFAHGETFASAIARHEHTLAHRIGIKKDMKVLDVGCGVGGPARQMAKFTGANITGITINEYQVERATRYAELEGLSRQLQFVQGDFMSLPFEEETFDAVYAIEATVHAPVLEDVYRQVYNVLKPGGVFGLYEWVMTDAYDDNNLRHRDIRLGIEQGDGIANMQTAKTAVEAIQAAGFELLEVEDLSQSTDGGNSTRAPWYWPLDGSSWRCANTIGDVLGTFRMTPAGRTVAHAMLTVMEAVGLAPPGTKKTADSLARAADALVAGGKEGLFTPMFLMVARKPFAEE
ncbi:Delta(24)-sterol C-methyltransferase [Pyricularia oryzae]|nr:Delta(24)-sterol C-methyltransferase [Pyricularia oryzae]KAI6264829.1 Delta(24)-sterol C-methyltransferase [Pyricularia oryzae]KAI6292521.1 Delta(24)-sterol C-methyltransferase [Pyricularia oryzae]KAI6299220.1 Delta(24)-sterol C-methyltransferase [Pyricularia oryzae]KAI6327965.1 Delta(24)-sterol C-methyltransferase [Pyricularia oryzae]